MRIVELDRGWLGRVTVALLLVTGATVAARAGPDEHAGHGGHAGHAGHAELAESAEPAEPADRPADVPEEGIDWDRVFGEGGAPAPAGGPAESADPAEPSTPGGEAPAADRRAHHLQREQRIGANRRAAIEAYEAIQDDEDVELSNIERRLASNVGLAAKYRTELEESESRRRYLQVDFLNRTLHLKKQRDGEKLTEALFASLVEREENRYASRIGEVESDVEFFRQELAAAQLRIGDLRSQRDLIVASRPRGIRAQAGDVVGAGGTRSAPEPPLHERLIGEMSATLKRLSGFQTRYTMDPLGECDTCLRAAPHGDSGHDVPSRRGSPTGPIAEGLSRAGPALDSGSSER